MESMRAVLSLETLVASMINTPRKQKASVSDMLDALKECSRSRDLAKGLEIHEEGIQTGLHSNKYVNTSLINMFGKCGRMDKALEVFDKALPSSKDVAAWTALITGYVDNGEYEKALELFSRMIERGDCVPNSRTFVAAISACASLGSRSKFKHEEAHPWLIKGRELHSQANASSCCRENIFVESALVQMYASCASLVEARRFYQEMKVPSVVALTALLKGYVDNGESEVALEMFERMEEEQGITRDDRVYVLALTACSNLASRGGLEKGIAIHAEVVERRCTNIFVESSLVHFYAACGRMKEARIVFDSMKERNVVAWNTLLQGYVDNGECELALEFFNVMNESGDCAPDSRSFYAALSACLSLAEKKGNKLSWLQKGEEIFNQGRANTCNCDVFVSNTMINLYSSCGKVSDAREVFQKMGGKNSVSWNNLIMGHINNGKNELALELVSQMLTAGMKRNAVSFVAALTACGNLLDLRTGKLIQAEIFRHGFEQDPVLGNCLVDFFGKCGCMEVAKHVFDSLADESNTVSWTSLMCGYSSQGNTEQVFEAFHGMKDRGVPPNEVTFICLLTACSHAGLVRAGERLLQEMSELYGMKPSLKHYSCVIDLLGRANRLDEAMEVLRGMPFEGDAVIWTAFLAACRKWKNDVMGKVAFEALVRLGAADASFGYVLLASVYDGGVGAPVHIRSGQTLWSDDKGCVHKFLCHES